VPEGSTLLLFTAASLVVLVVPGPAMLYIVTRGVEQGRRAGLLSMLGVETGALLHVAGAALGLSALLASSATAFSLVKYAGAAYLVYLGVQRLRASGSVHEPGPLEPRRGARVFRQGVLVQVLNPKVAVFFVAFLPQFVDPSRSAAAVQIVVLGVLFVLLAVLSDGACALLAGALGELLRRGARARRRLERSSGVVYLGLGAAVALSGPGSTGPTDR
jgi:threonine/homoserine/homoserine lactone efflux protein